MRYAPRCWNWTRTKRFALDRRVDRGEEKALGSRYLPEGRPPCRPQSHKARSTQHQDDTEVVPPGGARSVAPFFAPTRSGLEFFGQARMVAINVCGNHSRKLFKLPDGVTVAQQTLNLFV